MDEPLTVLIIDDNEDDRMLYRRILEKSKNTHYHIVEASNGDQGLKQIQEDQPACVLLDYSLPGHDGIEVLKRIREQYPFLPIVMLTGQGNESIAVAAMQQGVQNYILKTSITLETMEHVIRMAIQHCGMKKRIADQRSALEVFTRALAHDLNEPVRTIRSFIELINQSDDVFSAKNKSYFQHIQNAADRMRILIDTVFLYTRLDNPDAMPKEDCDMSAILQEVRENLAQLIHERGATIISDPLPHVYASRIQMIQLMQNLASNAIHHSNSPVTIRISAEAQDENLVFRVQDNGPGIDLAYVQKIFEPFKRMAHREEQGAGLGLAICKKIIESHNGKIWCESAPGAGADFVFTLPKTLPAKERILKTENTVSTPATADKYDDQPLANVLLVDDNKAFLDIAQITLMEVDQLHCNFFVARSGKEALARIHDQSSKKKPIDLVLLDINMPGMDGFEVLERVRADKNSEHISVVMCTGSNYDKDMERAKALGAVGYLIKPIEFSKLKSVIDVSSAFRLCPKDSGYALRRIA